MVKNNFHISIWLTFSKTMAIVILIVGSIFAYIFGNSEVIIFTLSLSGGLAGLKSWSEGLTRRRKIDKWNGNYNSYDDYDTNSNSNKPFDEIG